MHYIYRLDGGMQRNVRGKFVVSNVDDFDKGGFTSATRCCLEALMAVFRVLTSSAKKRIMRDTLMTPSAILYG